MRNYVVAKRGQGAPTRNINRKKAVVLSDHIVPYIINNQGHRIYIFQVRLLFILHL